MEERKESYARAVLDPRIYHRSIPIDWIWPKLFADLKESLSGAGTRAVSFAHPLRQRHRRTSHSSSPLSVAESDISYHSCKEGNTRIARGNADLVTFCSSPYIHFLISSCHTAEVLCFDLSNLYLLSYMKRCSEITEHSPEGSAVQ